MTAAGLRRFLHALTGAVVLVAPLTSPAVFRWVLVAIAALAITGESVRLRVPSVRVLLQRWVPVYRPQEVARPSGAMWLWTGYALAGCFPGQAPMAGILTGALADPAAALAGATAGRHGTKTWRGTASAAAVAGGVIAVLGFGTLTIVAAAAVAAVLERWSGPLDDNLVVAPGVALTVWLLGGLRA